MPQDGRRGSRPKVPGSGGKKRSVLEMQILTDQVEQLVLLMVPRERAARQLNMPIGTYDDYVKRVEQRWADNPLPGQAEARKRQRRRIYLQITGCQAKGLHSEVEKRERLLAKIEGNEAARAVEISAPGGGPIAVKAIPEVMSALRKLIREPE